MSFIVSKVQCACFLLISTPVGRGGLKISKSTQELLTQEIPLSAPAVCTSTLASIMGKVFPPLMKVGTAPPRDE